jgi:hypothetical protein
MSAFWYLLDEVLCGLLLYWYCHLPCCLILVYVAQTNEPLGAKGPPLVGEEVRKEVGKVGS